MIFALGGQFVVGVITSVFASGLQSTVRVADVPEIPKARPRFICSLKRKTTGALTGTLLSPSAGDEERSAGGVASPMPVVVRVKSVMLKYPPTPNTPG